MTFATRFQRTYAFAVFSLRDFFKLIPFDSAYNWKAQVFMIFGEFSFASAAIVALALAAGWDTLLLSRNSLLLCLGAIFAFFWWAHTRAEKRLLHRFENEFRRLSKVRRVTMTIGVLLFVALSVYAVGRTGGAVHAHLAHVG